VNELRSIRYYSVTQQYYNINRTTEVGIVQADLARDFLRPGETISTTHEG